MKGVLLDYDTLDHGDVDLAPLERSLDELTVYRRTPAASTTRRLADADIAITNKVRFDAQLIDRLARIRLICIAATGVDNVDLDAAKSRDIGVANVTGYCTASVVQHVFALVLHLTLNLREYNRLIGSGAWQRNKLFNLLDFPVRELAGKSFGIIGYGTLGRAVADIARAFGMRVIVAERRGAPSRDGRLPFETVLTEADVLSLHCPLTDATRGLIGAAELARMKHDALLINTARGAIVDSTSLAEALAAQQLGGAGIDVLPEEPPRADEPLINLDLANLVITPHIAWAAREARQRAIDEMGANIRAFRNGDKRNRVA
jgi:glycerate dehydrogenase